MSSLINFLKWKIGLTVTGKSFPFLPKYNFSIKRFTVVMAEFFSCINLSGRGDRLTNRKATDAVVLKYLFQSKVLKYNTPNGKKMSYV